MLIPFIRERPATLLLVLRDSSKEWCISSLSKTVGLTYLHTLKTITHFYNLGLTEEKKSGRKKIITLTDKGREISSKLNQLMEAFKEEET